MRILLAGKNGQLGRCFQDAIARTTHELIALSSQELDVTNSSQVKEVVNKFRPDVIVNASAYTAVDKAESDQEMAYAVNHSGVEYLAKAAQSLAIPVIHVSTDYVFDGAAVEPYLPSDETNPQTVYGNSKLAGENALSEHCTQYLVLRTAWVFSEYGNNFVKTMLRLGNECDALSVVADQYGCPTYAGDLAQAIVQLCDHYQETKELAWGVHHYSGDMPTSWHGFARTIFAKAHKQGLLSKIPELTAISSDQYPTPSKRPEYSVLNTGTLEALSLEPSQWLTSLDKVLETLSKAPCSE
jgi:dTDP-4-dehydrorhamnose reductase